MGSRTEDGVITHFGRKDFQIKIRGYRIDVMEIEEQIRRIEGIEDAIVLSFQDNRSIDNSLEDLKLVAYVIETEKNANLDSRVKNLLSTCVPIYMIPSFIFSLDEFPLNPNGKVDRKEFPSVSDLLKNRKPALSADKQEHLAGMTETEKYLLSVWSELLVLKHIKVTDSFLDLGGHSLQASQLIAQVGDHFGIVLSMRYVFENPTIRQIAEQIDKLCKHSTIMTGGHKILDTGTSDKGALMLEIKID